MTIIEPVLTQDDLNALAERNAMRAMQAQAELGKRWVCAVPVKRLTPKRKAVLKPTVKLTPNQRRL